MAHLKGLNIVLKNIRKIKKDLVNVYGGAVEVAALETKRGSQQVVPVDTGYLRSSASTVFSSNSEGAEAHAFYTAGYASFVHEATWIPHRPPTTSKYLERPFNELVEDNFERMKSIISNFFTRNNYS